MNGPTMHSPSPQVPHAQVPHAQGPPPAAKGFPWGKALAGCGCLMFVGLVITAVLGFFAYRAGSAQLEELREDFGFIANLQEDQGATSNRKGGAASGTSTKGGDRTPQQESQEALNAEKIKAYLETPLTRAEIREFNEFIEAWKKNPAYVRWTKEIEELEAIGQRNKGKDQQSVADALRGARQAGRTMTAMTELVEAFDEHVNKHGGYEKHYSRTLRISGLILAAETVGKTHKKSDAHADEVSKLMLKERPEIAKVYQEAMTEAREAAKRAKDDQGRQAAAYQAMAAMSGGGPGTIALARMPAQSFQTWDALKPEQRKELEENMTTAFGIASWFGAGLHPGALFAAAYGAEMQEFAK